MPMAACKTSCRTWIWRPTRSSYLGFLAVGINQPCRPWLESDDVFHALPLKQLLGPPLVNWHAEC
jgi:hypothetical protein